MRTTLLGLFFLLFSQLAVSDEVRIVAGKLSYSHAGWHAEVTLRHEDSGWDHYADAWRVVTADNKILGLRTLYHPHVSEQPFTRSLGGIQIPDDVKVVYIEAHDKLHGWSKQRYKIELKR
ncbi:MAG: hypothetical protein BMS9Abin26_0690 [Gammaproteobacteria bacterium]|nr:MAG: hypothetical protein BMS9Abin26_0690 [Gammaproteobacteria bacterium]